MSLNDCLSKPDIQLPPEDVALLRKRFSELREDGKDVPEASKLAARALMAEQAAERRTVTTRVQEAGGTVPNRAERYRQFAGVEASTADTMQLATAMDRIAQGWDANEVRQETGWHQGPDGKWRFEIADNQAELTVELTELEESSQWSVEDTVYRLGDVIDHDNLFAAYPDAANIEFVVEDRPKGQHGSFDMINKITVSKNAPDPLSTILHEVQHWIQLQEDFANGGSSATVLDAIAESVDNKVVKDLISQVEARESQLNRYIAAGKTTPKGGTYEPVLKIVTTRLEKLRAGDKTAIKETLQETGKAFEMYQRLAGEVEARNTQKRQKMDASDRQWIDPELTADTAREDVIVTYNGRVVQTAANSELPAVQGETVPIDDQIFVRLSNASDLSTFLHESAHVFLIMEQRLAAAYGMTEEAQAVLDMLGVQSFDEIGTEQHELFARTFENYLMQGKAPSLKLQSAFAAFSEWLSRIYQGLKQAWLEGQSKPLTPEITDVFDRLLATQVELEQAAVSPEYAQMFRSAAEAGMTAKEWESYLKRVAAYRTRSQMTLEDKVLDQFRKWHSDEWAAERKGLVDDELAKLAEEPIYNLMTVLSVEKMDSALVREALGVEQIPPGRILSYSSKNGSLDPSMLAEEFGFPDVNTMLDDLRGAPTIKQKAKDNAQERMVEKYGDILNDGTIEAEAREAFHNETHAELLLAEIRILRKRVPKAKDINNAQIKAMAIAAVDGMRASDLSPSKFHRAEVRAARKAAAEKDPATAREYKIQQLTNHHLFNAATKAQQAYAKARPLITALKTRTYNPYEVDPTYATQIQALARLYEVNEPKDRQAQFYALVNWIETQAMANPDFQPMDMQLVTVLAERKAQRDAGVQPTANYQPKKLAELTVAEVNGLVQMLRHLRWVGGRASLDVQNETKAERAEGIASILGAGGKDREYTPGEADSFASQFSHFVNSIVSLRNLVRRLDGFADGVMKRLVHARIAKSYDKALELNRTVGERYNEELKGISGLSLGTDSKLGKKLGFARHTVTQTKADGTDWSLDEAQRFMLATYWGDEYAREAVRDGWKVTDTDVEAMLVTLTDAQVALVNAVWKINGEMWPELAATSARRYGQAPDASVALPFSIGTHQYTGGHMRLFYDIPNRKANLSETENYFSSGMAPGKAGSVYARKGSGGRPVLLDKHNIFRAIEDNIHFIAYSDTGVELQRLLGNTEIQDAIALKHGEGFLRAFKESVRGLTVNQRAVEENPLIATALRWARGARTYSFLAYSVRNTVQQFSSLAIVSRDVGTFSYLEHAAKFYMPGKLAENLEFVRSRSQMMRSRSKLVNTSAAEFMEQIVLTGKAGRAWQLFKKHGFTPQAWVDMTIAFPTWMAKYQAQMEAYDATTTTADPAARSAAEAQAAADADTLISESIGSGADIHLGRFFRSNQSQWVRTLGAFGSWFNMYFNRAYRETEGFSKFDTLRAWDALITTPIMVATLSAFLVADGPDDDQSIAGWAWEKYWKFGLGTVPIVRDAVGVFDGFSPDAGHAPLVEAPKALWDFGEQLLEDEKGAAGDAAAALRVISAVTPVPLSGTAVRMLDYAESASNGGEDPVDTPADFVGELYQSAVEGADRDN